MTRIKETQLYRRLCDTAYEIQKKDIEAAAKVIAEAFSDDPAIRYLLGGKSVGENDCKYFTCLLKAIYGKCVIVSTNDTIKNVLILFPPELQAVPTLPFLVKGGIKLIRHFGIGLFTRSISYENNCRRIKRKYVTPKTWYCMCFVVSPEHQGRGEGGRLLKPILQIFDDEQIPLYLETHKRVNTDIYKRFGFEVVEKAAIPKTEITQYSMLRKQP